ncbi:MAG: Gfo/Idh/MocA family oxidoreductase [Segetibacter sp.]
MRKLRMGMIGGGAGAFIGVIHRMAAIMDGEIELVCGAFSSDPKKSKDSGKDLSLDPSRVYDSFQEMIAKEKELPDDVKMDFVSIVTPNHVHFEPAKMAMENGFHVVLDKPMTFNSCRSERVKRGCTKDRKIFLSYSYIYRLSFGERSPCTGAKRQAWQYQKNFGYLSAGMAQFFC